MVSTSILPTPWIGFPGDPVVKKKNPPANSGFNPWVGKIPWRRKWQPTPVFLPGKSHGQRSLMGYSPGGHWRVRHDWATKQTTPCMSGVGQDRVERKAKKSRWGWAITTPIIHLRLKLGAPLSSGLNSRGVRIFLLILTPSPQLLRHLLQLQKQAFCLCSSRNILFSQLWYFGSFWQEVGWTGAEITHECSLNKESGKVQTSGPGISLAPRTSR